MAQGGVVDQTTHEQERAMSNLAVLRDGQPGAQVEQARWICGPYRCFWRPNDWEDRVIGDMVPAGEGAALARRW
jgi:hypothetical protein